MRQIVPSHLALNFLLLLSSLALVKGTEEALGDVNIDPMTTTEFAHPYEFMVTAATPVDSITQPTGRSPGSRVAFVETRSGKKEIPVTDNFFTSFATAFGMIIFSELGDKTFLIAAIMAMRHSRTRVFLAASMALTLMTVISVIAGRIIPALISPRLTTWIAAGLFLVFGVMMVREGLEMAPDRMKEEYDEVAHEIEGARPISSSDNLASLEEAQSSQAAEQTNSEVLASRIDALLGGSASPVAIQVFSMVFLAEWGDRSQLATIVLAAAQNPWGVAIGASSGHAVCSLIAVFLGRALSSFLSIRSVTISGGLLFILFAFLSVV